MSYSKQSETQDRERQYDDGFHVFLLWLAASPGAAGC